MKHITYILLGLFLNRAFAPGDRNRYFARYERVGLRAFTEFI